MIKLPLKKSSGKKLEECTLAAWSNTLDVIVEHSLRQAASAGACG